MTYPYKKYILMLADNALVLGQRMGEWSNNAPEMELDIAAGNLALDLIGQAKFLYEYLEDWEGETRNADQIAMTRPEHEYTNIKLVEQPNTDWGFSMLRNYLFATFQRLQYRALMDDRHAFIAHFSAKAVKELDYHVQFSRSWVIRLGDGTQESHGYMERALERLWRFTGEMFKPSEAEQSLIDKNEIKSLADIKTQWEAEVLPVLAEAMLTPPENTHMQLGGKQGQHSEHMGHLLSELQYMQRAYPGLEW